MDYRGSREPEKGSGVGLRPEVQSWLWFNFHFQKTETLLNRDFLKGGVSLLLVTQ